MIGRFESIAQSLQVSIAQKAASFLAAEPPRSLFARGLATQKIRVLDRTFQIEQVGQLAVEPGPLFVQEALRMRGLAAWHLGDDATARDAFTALGKDAPPGRALESERWLTRLRN